MSMIIHPMLLQLKESSDWGCYAFVNDSDVPEELRSTSAPPPGEFDNDDNWNKRWDWLMDEIIWSFNEYVSIANIPDYEADEHRMRNGFILFGKYYTDLSL